MAYSFSPDTGGTLITNLSSYWNLDETSGDRSDLVGSRTLSDNNTVGYATGKYNNAADFEAGNTEYLSISDANWGSEPTGDFSFSFWIKPETLPSTDYVIIGKDQSGGRSFYIGLKSTGRIEVGINDTSFATSDATVTAGSWFHIVFTYDYVTSGNSVMKIYINGNQSGSTVSNAVGPMADTTTEWCFGRRTFTGSELYYDGLIDEIGFWNKVLSTTEITDLYNSGNGNSYREVVNVVFIPKIINC